MTTLDERVKQEQSRARYPDEEGYVERDGVRIFYEVYGSGEPTVLLLPTWSIVHSRHWKMQIPYLARHCRVLTFDGRGNGRSDRPAGARRTTMREFAADALAVMDATGTERAVLVGVSCGALCGRSCSRPTTRSASTAPSSSARRSRWRRHCPSERSYSFDERARHRRGLGEVQQPLLAARLPRLPRVLLREVLHRAALDEADRGLRRLGTRDDARDARRRTSRGIGSADRRRVQRARARASAARCSSSTATRTRSARTRRASRSRRRPAASSSRSRAPATCRTRATR